WLCGSVARRRVAGGSLSVYPGADGRQCRGAARVALRGIPGRSARAQARADWLCSVVRYLLSRYSLCWLAAAVGGCAVSDGGGSRRWDPPNDRARLWLCAADGPGPPGDSDDRGRRDRLYGRRMVCEPGCALSRWPGIFAMGG